VKREEFEERRCARNHSARGPRPAQARADVGLSLRCPRHQPEWCGVGELPDAQTESAGRRVHYSNRAVTDEGCGLNDAPGKTHRTRLLLFWRY